MEFMRLERFVEKRIRHIFVFLLVLDLIVCAFAEAVEEMAVPGTGHRNVLCMLIGAGLVLFIAFFYMSVSDVKNRKGRFRDLHIGLLGKDDRVFLLFSSVLLLLYLIFSTHFYYFETGWDAGTVIWNAQLLADGRIAELENDYFSIYPNNVILSVLFSYIIKAGRMIPIGTDYYVLVAFQCICMVICSNLIFKTLLSLSLPEYMAHVGRCIFILIAVLSPWVVLPYSDTVGMFFMVLIVYVYTLDKHRFLLGFLVLFGAMIKPTVFIFAVALFLVVFPEFLQNRHDKGLLKSVILFMVGALIAYISAKALIHTAGFEINKDSSMGPAHYLMMGLNEEYRGVINVEDQDFSIGISDPGERVRSELAVAKARFKEMWPGRLFHHLLRKELYSAGDGTFAWGVDGQFFFTYIWTGHERLENIFRDFYYPERRFYNLYRLFMQSMWLGMIIFSVIGALSKGKDKYRVLYLTIVGMILFEMIFEPRARHMLLCVPIMCITASDSASALAARIKGLIRRKPRYEK